MSLGHPSTGGNPLFDHAYKRRLCAKSRLSPIERYGIEPKAGCGFRLSGLPWWDSYCAGVKCRGLRKSPHAGTASYPFVNQGKTKQRSAPHLPPPVCRYPTYLLL